MSVIKNLVGGLVGAVALNILHETLKRQKTTVPRIDLLGEEAVQKVLGTLGTGIKSKENLYQATLVSDVISNTIYYSLIGAGKRKSVWPKALFLGLTAGVGAVSLPKPMGLNPAPTSDTDQKKVLTVGYYLFGAVVSALVINKLNKK